MNAIAVRNIHRADAGTIASLERLGVATVHEAQGRTGLMLSYMRPLWRGARVAGSAVTALCHPGDNWMIHVACDVVKKGDILVVACSSENSDGAFGELLATSLKALGVKGVVLDMGCRDAAEISEMKFPLWSRAISAKGTVKASVGSVNVPVVCAGLQVRPGDVVVADDDGVVVVNRVQATEIARLGEEREKKEAATRAHGEVRLFDSNVDLHEPARPSRRVAVVPEQIVPAVVEHDSTKTTDDVARIDDRQAARFIGQGDQTLLRQSKLSQRTAEGSVLELWVVGHGGDVRQPAELTPPPRIDRVHVDVGALCRGHGFPGSRPRSPAQTPRG